LFEDDGGNAETIIKDRYLNVLKKKFIPALKRRCVNIEDTWFQQDGATPHTSGAVIDWLSKTFERNFISFRNGHHTRLI